jgi:serine/threonine-protein kinase
MHRKDIPLPPRRLNKDIPETLEEIILKVLSKEPASRYRTADQLGRVLLSFGNLNEDKTGPIILPQPGSENQHQFFKTPSSQPSEVKSSIQSLPESDEGSEPAKEEEEIDWITWGLGLLAFTAVLGLIPFWLFIYFSIKP